MKNQSIFSKESTVDDTAWQASTKVPTEVSSERRSDSHLVAALAINQHFKCDSTTPAPVSPIAHLKTCEQPARPLARMSTRSQCDNHLSLSAGTTKQQIPCRNEGLLSIDFQSCTLQSGEDSFKFLKMILECSFG